MCRQSFPSISTVQLSGPPLVYLGLLPLCHPAQAVEHAQQSRCKRIGSTEPHLQGSSEVIHLLRRHQPIKHPHEFIGACGHNATVNLDGGIESPIRGRINLYTAWLSADAEGRVADTRGMLGSLSHPVAHVLLNVLMCQL